VPVKGNRNQDQKLMPQLLTLTRAARLIGIRRGALQKKIRDGKLETFEGMVKADDLLRLYPNTSLPGDAALARIDKIKDDAYSQRVRERVLPSAEILVARLNKLAREHARVKSLLEHHHRTFEQLGDRLNALEDSGGAMRKAITSLKTWLSQELDEHALTTGEPPALNLEDSFLRIMAAHIYLEPSRHEFFVEGNDDILNAGLRSGLALSYGCRDGHCGMCKARVLSGQIKRIRASGYALSADELELGYALLCCNTAVTDLVVEAPEAVRPEEMPPQHISTAVKDIARTISGMMVLQLHMPASGRMRFLAGQSVTLRLANGHAADVPVASCPCDESSLQFHLTPMPGDLFSDYVFHHLAVAEAVMVSGPQGNFVLKPGSPNPIIFVAVETGFAPIKSLIEHAIAMEVAESLHLYWIVGESSHHYMHNLCRSWSDALDNFWYTPLVATLEHRSHTKIMPSDIRRQESRLEGLLEHIRIDHPDLGEFDIYTAGPALAMHAARNLLLAEGLPKTQLFVEPINENTAR